MSTNGFPFHSLLYFLPTSHFWLLDALHTTLLQALGAFCTLKSTQSYGLPISSSGCPDVHRDVGKPANVRRSVIRIPRTVPCRSPHGNSFAKLRIKTTAAKTGSRFWFSQQRLAKPFEVRLESLRVRNRTSYASASLSYQIIRCSALRLAIAMIQTPWLFDFLKMLPSPVSGSVHISWLLSSIGYHTRVRSTHIHVGHFVSKEV